MSSDEEAAFLKFHKVASARKMDLAMRGLPVKNAAIEDLYGQAKLMPEAAWDEFLRCEFPSPRQNDDLTSRPLMRMTDRLGLTFHGDSDLDIDAIMDAGETFIEVCRVFGGPFAALTVHEARMNLDKIKEGMREVGAAGSSLKSVLFSEVRSGMHGAGGVLKDPSAAMGILWLIRFIAFWEEICSLRSKLQPPADAATPLRGTVEDAYSRCLQPYHGWVTQKAFEMAFHASPTWEEVLPYFADSPDVFREDVKAFTRVSQGLQDRVMSALRELDLVDIRKSV